jgi:hypothetical protein
MRFLISALLLCVAWAAEEDPKGGPPPFFLVDTVDQLCLSGEEFKRCSIDTLFYVVGPPGKLVISCFLCSDYGMACIDFLPPVFLESFVSMTQVPIKFTSDHWMEWWTRRKMELAFP